MQCKEMRMVKRIKTIKEDFPMKTKKLDKRLELNKATIVDLTNLELKKVKGGACTIMAHPGSCFPTITCMDPC
jgi:hypothetical protein